MGDRVNIAEEFGRQAILTPGGLAILTRFGKLSYAELDKLVWRATTLLSQLGVKAGQTNALAFVDELSLLVYLLASMRLGCASMVLPNGLPSAQLSDMLASVKPDTWLTDSKSPYSESINVIQLNMDSVSKVTLTIDYSLCCPNPDVTCLYTFGSGSTGRQKLISYTHQQLFEAVNRTRQQYLLTTKDRLATMVNLNFISAQRRYFAALLSGAAVVIPNRAKLNPVKLVKIYQVTVLSATVSYIAGFLNSLPENPKRQKMTFLRILLLSSSTVSDALRERIRKHLTPNLYITYGTNECPAMTWAGPPDIYDVAGTVGFPMDGVNLQVVDDMGAVVPPGIIGQVRVQAPGLVTHYADDPEASQQAFREGWFYPGDLARYTQDGQLVFCGRADHMMIMNGINIYPAEIENVVGSHPDVLDVAAVPLKCAITQDIPICAASFRAGATVSPGELKTFAAQRLGVRCPHHVVRLDEIPRDERGKLNRETLELKLTGLVKSLNRGKSASIEAGFR